MDLLAVALLVAVFAALWALVRRSTAYEHHRPFGLVVCVAVLIYLLYALLRGERF